MYDGAGAECALHDGSGGGVDVVLEDQRSLRGALAFDGGLVLDTHGDPLERTGFAFDVPASAAFACFKARSNDRWANALMVGLPLRRGR